MQSSNSITTALASLGWGKEAAGVVLKRVKHCFVRGTGGREAKSSEFCKYEVLKFWGFVGHK